MTLKRKIGMCVLFLVVLALPLVHAEKYYVLTAHLSGPQVIVSSVKMENVPVAIPETDGGYLIEVASIRDEVLYSGKYTLQTESASLYIPHEPEGNHLIIKKTTGEILQKVSVALFSSVCGDSVCQSTENEKSCSLDCKIVDTTNQQEETQEIKDQEEAKPPQTETPIQLPIQKKPIIKKPAKKNMAHILIIGGVLGVIMTSGGFWIALKNAKQNRLDRIRQYVQKYAAYPQEQVKRALLMRGIKEEDIAEALRQN